MAVDWKREISVLVYIKQVISKLDSDGIWAHHLPEVGASDKEIAQAESVMGMPLDNEYTNFLRFANGWKSFYQSVDLFGTSDLVGSQAMSSALLALDSLDDLVLKESSLHKEDLFPIGYTDLDIDLFLMGKPLSATPGEVFWFAGQEIERFSSFESFFMAMVDYNRSEVEELKK